jgi:hypothetical protein
MTKEQILQNLAIVSETINEIAQGQIELIEIMPTLMETSDLLDETIGGIEDELTETSSTETQDDNETAT